MSYKQPCPTFKRRSQEAIAAREAQARLSAELGTGAVFSPGRWSPGFSRFRAPSPRRRLDFQVSRTLELVWWRAIRLRSAKASTPTERVNAMLGGYYSVEPK